ncbi:hypothetical protein BDR26DRAFT_853466 [Obelidium mucronatum]|nr:hypothetical protein BDR26DRAFT_853466 [Obelidium mucronatum]
MYHQSTISSISTADRPTLQSLLDPFAVYGDQFDARFGCLTSILEQVIGTSPSAFHTYSIWPLLVESYASLLGSDRREKMKIGLDLRRLTGIVSSLVAQCAYCSALGCGLGDVFNGAVKVTQPLRISAGDLSAGERKAIRLVVAATKVPARVTVGMQVDVEKGFGGKVGMQQLANILAVTGFTNTLNALLACELDEPLNKRANIAFKGMLYSLGPHQFKNRMKRSKKASEPSSSEPTTTSSTSSWNPFKYIFDFLHLYNEWTRVLRITDGFQSKLPTTHTALNQWLENTFGFQPRYLTQIQSLEIKRVYCTLLSKLVFWTDQDDDIASGTFDGVYKPDFPFTDRLIVCYVYMMGASNHLLALHFAYVAVARYGVQPWELEMALMAAQDFNHKEPKEMTDMLEIMVALGYYSARRYHKRMWRLAPRLLVATENPATVMAFVSLTSVLTLLHRYSAMVEDWRGAEQPEVAAFQLSEGVSLGLDKVDAFSNSRDFDASVEELEIEWDDVDLDSINIASASLRMAVGQVWGGGVDY